MSGFGGSGHELFKNVHDDLAAPAFSLPTFYPKHSSQILKMFLFPPL